MNALRHGLTARVVVLPSEDMDAYNAFSKEIVDSLEAQTPVERQFAQTVADNQWRINRIRSIEDGMLGMGHFEAAGDFDCPSPEIHSAMTAARAFRDDSKSFVNLSLYEQRLTGPLYGGLSAAPFDERRSPPAQRAPDRAPRALPSRPNRRTIGLRSHQIQLCQVAATPTRGRMKSFASAFIRFHRWPNVLTLLPDSRIRFRRQQARLRHCYPEPLEQNRL